MDVYRMFHGEDFGVLAGTILLGAVHGIEPGHGWPVAASYALDRTHTWVSGFAASFLLGIGHLISSIAMVVAFFYVKGYFNLTQVNEPISVELLSTTIVIGGPVSLVAGVLLIALGVHEYRHGHAHGDAHDNDHAHDHDRAHAQDEHAHDSGGEGLLARVTGVIPFIGGHAHAHDDLDSAADRGLVGIAWFAFVLGFAHEEEFEIIALCAGSTRCLELMSAYAITVLVGIVGLTMLLLAGYQHSTARVERYAPYLPAVSATVLIVMGLGFIAGLL